MAFQTHFPRVGALGFDVGVGIGRGGCRGSGFQRIALEGDEALRRITHLAVRPPELEEGKEPSLDAGDQVGQDRRQADGRIGHIVGPGSREGGSPVHTARHIQVDLALPAQLGGREEALDLVVILAFVGFDAGHVEVPRGEEVGDGVEVAAEGEVPVIHVLEGGAGRPHEGEGSEPLVQVEHHVGIDLAGVLVVLLIEAEFLGEDPVRRSRILLFVKPGRIVHLGAAAQGESLENLIGEPAVDHEAVLVVHQKVAVDGPVGVLQAEALVAPRPVLGLEPAGLVVHLEQLIGVEAVAGRQEVGGHDGVHVLSLGNHVLFMDVHEHGRQVHPELFRQVRAVADGDIVPFQTVIGNDAFGICRCQGEEGLVLLAAGGNRDGVRGVVPRLEEIQRVVAARNGHLAAPGLEFTRSGAVGVLELRRDKRAVEGRAVGIRDVQAAVLPLAGGDQDDAVLRLAAVQGRCRRTAEDGDILDILRVEHGGAVARLGHAAEIVFRLTRLEGRHRDTIDHVQGVVVVRDGLGTPHHDLHAAADSGRAGIDLDARHLAGEGIHEVGILDLGQFGRLDFLHIVGEGLGLLPDTKCRHNHPFQDVRILLQGDIDDLLTGDIHQHIRHTDVGEAQLGSTIRNLKCVVSVEIRDGADRRLAFDNYSCPDQRLIVLVHHGTRDGTRSLRQAENRHEP